MGSRLPTGFVPAQPGVPNFIVPFIRGKQFGHDLYVQIVMQFAPGVAGSDCRLEWWERMDRVPPFYAKLGAQPFVWNEMFAKYPVSPVFDPWNEKVNPCPQGGTLTIEIHDPPALGFAPGWTSSRVLDIRVEVHSGTACACSATVKRALGTQTLRVINGTIVLQRFNVAQQNY